jgi:hypothetical protein
MAADDLRTALEGLRSERIQRLLDRLEKDREAKVNVCACGPHGPMLLAGYRPRTEALQAPEIRFAEVWDRFATPEPQSKRLSWRSSAARQTQRCDVQRLLRTANAVLAGRTARPGSDAPSSGALPASRIVADDERGPADRR